MRCSSLPAAGRRALVTGLCALALAACAGEQAPGAATPSPDLTGTSGDGATAGASAPSQPVETASGAGQEPGETSSAAPGETASEAPEVAPSGPFPAARVRLRTAAGDEVPVAVHVAADPDTRRRGLMHREDVPPGTGMLFLFPDDRSGAFWMKDTLVPLSIAFTDADGRILRILRMEPCESDPCRRYDPGVTYRMALEVPQGDFVRLGVREGDVVVVPGDLSSER